MAQSDTVPNSPPIRDAATLVLLRREAGMTRVLMGQRGRTAAFLPGKFVFPGGALDMQDYAAPPPVVLTPPCHRRLAELPRAESRAEGLPDALARAATRELTEETGLALSPQSALHFVFRAITPPNRPRRFDARFFVTEAEAIQGDPDDFSRAEDELSHLQWIDLSDVRRFDLPFVTRVVLGEVAATLKRPMPPDHVPFYDHIGGFGKIRTIR